MCDFTISAKIPNCQSTSRNQSQQSDIPPCNIWGNVHNGKAGRPENFRPRTNLLLKFFPAELGVHPGGFSGAGIWYHKPTPKPEVWSPNLALAGICTHYYPRRTLLLITRVERLVTFLDKIAPGR